MNNNPKYTNEGLPIVSEETIDIYLRDISIRSDEISSKMLAIRCVDLIGTQLEQENPLLYLMEQLQITDYTKTELDAYRFGFASAYGLLRRQAEINKLEERSSE